MPQQYSEEDKRRGRRRSARRRPPEKSVGISPEKLKQLILSLGLIATAFIAYIGLKEVKENKTEGNKPTKVLCTEETIPGVDNVPLFDKALQSVMDRKIAIEFEGFSDEEQQVIAHSARCALSFIRDHMETAHAQAWNPSVQTFRFVKNTAAPFSHTETGSDNVTQIEFGSQFYLSLSAIFNEVFSAVLNSPKYDQKNQEIVALSDAYSSLVEAYFNAKFQQGVEGTITEKTLEDAANSQLLFGQEDYGPFIKYYASIIKGSGYPYVTLLGESINWAMARTLFAHGVTIEDVLAEIESPPLGQNESITNAVRDLQTQGLWPTEDRYVGNYPLFFKYIDDQGRLYIDILPLELSGDGGGQLVVYNEVLIVTTVPDGGEPSAEVVPMNSLLTNLGVVRLPITPPTSGEVSIKIVKRDGSREGKVLREVTLRFGEKH